MYDTIIVGAGAAGLMAARQLAQAGKRIVILEARDRIGGRIYPLSADEFGYEAMGGAEFVHGDAPLTCALVQEAGLTLNHPTEWWNVLDGEPTSGHRSSIHRPALEAKLKEVTEDMTLIEFLDAHFPAEHHAKLREYAIRRVEGYDAGDAARASVRAFRESTLGSESSLQRNLKEGYGALLRYLFKDIESSGAEVLLKRVVTKIDHSGEKARVTCASGETFESRKVILTVPLPLIGEIAYEPAKPEIAQAAANIGVGTVIKILLRFKSRWWTGMREKQFEKLFFMFSNETIPTWWTQYPESHPVLTGWAAGPRAHALRAVSREQLLDTAIMSLSHIFDISISALLDELVAHAIIDWDNEPYSKGAYSYVTPETESALAVLSQPLSGKVCFAGEVFGGDAASTVEGALVSGKRSAEWVLN